MDANTALRHSQEHMGGLTHTHLERVDGKLVLKEDGEDDSTTKVAANVLLKASGMSAEEKSARLAAVQVQLASGVEPKPGAKKEMTTTEQEWSDILIEADALFIQIAASEGNPERMSKSELVAAHNGVSRPPMAM
jgi:hypothetical protein